MSRLKGENSMSNGTEPWESSVEEPTRSRILKMPGIPLWGMPAGSLVNDSGPKVDTTVLPPDQFSSTAKQTVEIIGFGDPVAQPGPYIDKVYEKDYISTFGIELMQLLNKYSKENTSNTPDWILSEYMQDALEAYNKAVAKRERWYGRKVF
jgi:hypothetical protein